jgi:DNA topoisomerase-1
LRVLGAHPRDKKPVELYAGRYGPYVKHGAVNATVRDRDSVAALTLEQAIALLDAKAGAGSTPKETTGAAAPASKRAKAPPSTAREPVPAARTTEARKRSTVKVPSKAQAQPKAPRKPRSTTRGATARASSARKRK